MAVDEAILESVGDNQSLPCLRLYAWEPACLSIGYAQSWREIDHQQLADLGWDWVRRPTGGRAILHTDELTYSVIAPSSEPRVTGSVLESYQRLSMALLAALHFLDIPASANPVHVTSNGTKTEPVCFEVPSNYEIVVQGKKLVGSAQARRKEAVLQHGTLPLWGDLTRITQALRYPGAVKRREAAARLLDHATTVETAIGHRIEWSSVTQAFIRGFEKELNLGFLLGDLSDREATRARRLIEEKYEHPSWSERT